MKITNEVINDIRNRTNIIDIVSSYLPLSKKGKNYFGVCPFHDDHSPSMSVSFEKQIYTCFSCGASGNVFDFVANYEHIGFYDAVKILGNKIGYNLESVKLNTTNNSKDYEIYDFTSRFYQNNLRTSLGKNALNYLKNRQISDTIIKKFDIGLSIQNVSVTEFLLKKGYSLEKLIDLGISNNNSNDIFFNRIIFPLYDLNGNVVGFSGRIYNTKDNSKYINSKESELFKKSNVLYNYHRVKEHLKKKDSVIIMEGFLDVIRASTIGVDNCVATMGTAFTKQHASLIKKLTDNVILCYDGDAAGEKATLSTIEILEGSNLNIKVIRLEDNLDPDEYILSSGKEAFINKIEKAISVIEYKMSILKKDKNLTSLKEISVYIDSSLKELSKLNDDILIELTLKKLSEEYKIEYETLKDKLISYKKKEIKDTKIVVKNNKVSNKYEKAQRNIINYMLKYEDVISIVEHRVPYFPNNDLNMLSNDIINYYHKYGIFILADFFTYIKDNEKEKEVLNDILNIELNNKDYMNEIEDYIYVIKDYLRSIKVKELENNLKQEVDPIKQSQILSEIMKVRGVK